MPVERFDNAVAKVVGQAVAEGVGLHHDSSETRILRGYRRSHQSRP
jgi:hypothetical protein